MRGRPIIYSGAELIWLEANSTLAIGDYHHGFVERFDRDDVSRLNLASLRKRMGWKMGRSGRFETGNVPANKGKPCPPGIGGRHPNARRAQFKKGAVPHTFQGAGHERIDSREGYVILIVAEPNPWTGAATRPVMKHRWLWEKANGPIPPGHCLKCRDGDKTNTDPSNWELIPRSILPRLNGGPAKTFLPYDEAAPDLKPTLIVLAKVDHALRVRARAKARRV